MREVQEAIALVMVERPYLNDKQYIEERVHNKSWGHKGRQSAGTLLLN